LSVLLIVRLLTLTLGPDPVDSRSPVRHFVGLGVDRSAGFDRNNLSLSLASIPRRSRSEFIGAITWIAAAPRSLR
jgi:hypothetical protein